MWLELIDLIYEDLYLKSNKFDKHFLIKVNSDK
jgi:hypothetical protein